MESFVPPCCPNRSCPDHSNPSFLYHRRGYYRRKIGPARVPRYICLRCGRSFSEQTFRLDYRLRKPLLSELALWAFSSKLTHRQSARFFRCSPNTIYHRLRLLGAHCRAFHELQLQRLKGQLTGDFALDELETFEVDRRLGPLTVSVLIHESSWMIVDTRVGTLAARGGLRPRDQARKEAFEASRGRRKSQSAQVVRQSLETLRGLFKTEHRGALRTDRKKTYPGLLKKALGDALAHLQTSSKEPRDQANPLFRINATLAMMRDGISRLVRRSWAHAKKAVRLQWHLWVWLVYRNYVRAIINRRPGESTGSVVGLYCGPLEADDVLGLRPEFRQEALAVRTAS